MLGIPARIGYAHKVGGIVDEVKDPSFSAAIGLCMGETNPFEEGTASGKNSLISNESGKTLKKMGSFFKEIFG